jgi:hypothetical protein
MPVVPVWYDGSLCGRLVMQAWHEGALCCVPVLGSVVMCWAWFQIKARRAERDCMPIVVLIERRLCRVWFQDGVVGVCGWRASDGDRDAEHAVPADRFAREIVGF